MKTNNDTILDEVLDACIKVLSLQSSRSKNKSQQDYLNDIVKKANLLKRTAPNIIVETHAGVLKKMYATSDVNVRIFESSQEARAVIKDDSMDTLQQHNDRVNKYLELKFMKEITLK